MKELSATTNRAQQIIESYRNSLKVHGTRDLYKVYANPSREKRSAWWDCQYECQKRGGEKLTIVSANKYQFSAMFQFRKDNKRYYAYITKSGQYCIPVQ